MIPYSTDAPIYHLPIATGALIVLNILLFLTCDPSGYTIETVSSFGTAGELESAEDEESAVVATEDGILRVRQNRPVLWLEYGTVKPWQWFTSIFMHADFVHLALNMIFLWAFGLIVEGKVGHWVFLGLYLLIGVGQSAIEQLIMLGAGEGASLGASAAIAGLLGIVLVWAPRNEFDCWMRFNTIEIPVTVFAGLWLLQEVVFMCITGAFGSEVLHLMGFAIGFAVGIAWVVRGWVDCEGYDLLAVWKGTEGVRKHEVEDAHEVERLLGHAPKSTTGNNSKPAGATAKKRRDAPPAVGQGAGPITTSAAIREQVTGLIREGNYVAANKLFQKLQSQDPTLQWKQDELVTMVKLAMQNKDYAFAEPHLKSLIDFFPASADTSRVALARIYLHQERPSLVLALYRNINPALLDEKHRTLARQLIAAAKKQQAEGTVELAE